MWRAAWGITLDVNWIEKGGKNKCSETSCFRICLLMCHRDYSVDGKGHRCEHTHTPTNTHTWASATAYTPTTPHDVAFL